MLSEVVLVCGMMCVACCDMNGSVRGCWFFYCCIVCFFFFFKQKTAYEMLRSLVGSEMCIRDSSTVVAEAGVQVHVAPAVFTRAA